jgi:hypothetical protein
MQSGKTSFIGAETFKAYALALYDKGASSC